MSVKLMNPRLSSLIVFLKRSAVSQPSFDLGKKMKMLNDKKQFRQALQLFDQYNKNNNIQTCSTSTIIQALNACAHIRDLQRGSMIHQHVSHRLEDDRSILTSLVHLYMQCGDVSRAELLFNNSAEKDLSVYTAMMKGYIQSNQAKKAVELFNCIETPDAIVFNVLFDACAQQGTEKALRVAKEAYEKMPKSFHSNKYTLRSMIDASLKCGDVPYAEFLFNRLPKKELPMYGTMMKGYIKNNKANKAIELFDEIENPDAIMFNLLFNACAQQGTEQSSNLAKKAFEKMPKSFQSNTYVLTSMIDAMMKCSDVSYAESLFNGSSKRESSMYGAMMKGYVKNNQANKVTELFNQIENPNPIMYNLFFTACAQQGTGESLNLVKTVYEGMPKSFHSNLHVVTSVLDALMKCGDVSNAELLFNKSSKKDLFMFGVMMKGYIKNNQAKKAIELFNQIEDPDPIIFNLLFNACAEHRTEQSLCMTKEAYEKMPKSFHSNTSIRTSLLDALMKCGDVSYAEFLFDRSVKKELSMYGAMMEGYIENDQPAKAVELFYKIENPDETILILVLNACAHLATGEALNLVKKISKEIPHSFQSSPRLFNSLLDALIKCGDCSSAEILHSKMIKSAESYGNLMSGFNKANNAPKTLDLFDQMKNDGIEATMITYLCIIRALSQIGDRELCQSIAQQIPNSFLSNHHLQTSLVNMWGKAGCVDQAKHVFENISQLDQFAYNAMINSYGLNGMGVQAIELYRQMPKELINQGTYVCVLNACSHSGLVDEARSIFQSIQIKTGIIYCTMIDCLSRAYVFEEAQELIDEYERSNPPILPLHMALLSGARNQKNISLSKMVYTRMKTLFPDQVNALAPAAVLLANVYASAGELDKASDIRMELYKSGAKKKVGLSMTVVNGQVYQFRAHDQSHPRSSEIYGELERISRELIEHGHEYDSSWLTRPLSEDETVASVLCGHSEKLAIAWNFVANPTTTRIQVTKNLRVCGDCHKATKLIAAFRRCEIVVRDANRIHHFYTNGQCSCNDCF